MMSGWTPVVLVAEELARPPQPGLDLVHDEERLVPPAQLLDGRPVVVGGEVDALALDGLDDEGGHVAARAAARARASMSPKATRVGREQGTETVAEFRGPRSTRAPRW